MHWFHDGSPEFVTRRQSGAKDTVSHRHVDILKLKIEFVQDKYGSNGANTAFCP